MKLINFQDVVLNKLSHMRNTPGLTSEASGHFNFTGKISKGFMPLVDRKTSETYYFYANYLYYYINDYFFNYDYNNTKKSYEEYLVSLYKMSWVPEFNPDIIAINNHFDQDFFKEEYTEVVNLSRNYEPYYYIYVLPEFITKENLTLFKDLGIHEIRTTSYYNKTDITDKTELAKSFGFIVILEEPSHISFIDRIEQNISNSLDSIQLKEIIYDKKNKENYDNVFDEYNVYKGIKYHIYNEGLPYILMKKYNHNIFDYDSLIQNLCYTQTDDPSIMVFFEVNKHIFI